MRQHIKLGLLIMGLMLLAACQPGAGTSNPPLNNTATPAVGVTTVPPTATLQPANTPSAAPAAVFGWVWNDMCAISGAGSNVNVAASPGCVQSSGSYHADGVMEASEKPIGGIKINLGSGACPSSGLLEMETITTDISYGFTNLKPGSYCISIDPLSEPNSAILFPGTWTSPTLQFGPISTTVTLAAGENKYDVNFGWDYLPALEEACTYRAAFLGDVTIPDNTITAPGTSFIKTWRLRNDSTCAWGPGQKLHSLAFFNGDPFGAPAQVPLPAVVQPGGTIDVSTNMVAPNQPGTYRSEWMLQVAQGPLLGVGADGQTPLHTQILVQAGQPGNQPCTYRAAFLGDVTIPDNSLLRPGAAFAKTWRLRNDGTCAWGPNAPVYAVTNVNGNSFGAPTVLSMPVVQPGGIVDLSINMVAPNAPGTHRSEWMFMVKEGGLRGVGAQGETPLYTQIVVQGLPPACMYRATFLGDLSVPDNIPIAAGAPFVKIWNVRNDSNCAWGPGQKLHSLQFVGGTQMAASAQVEIPTVVLPGQAVELSVPMVAPTMPGTYRSEWKLKVDNGPLVGVGPSGQSPLYAQIVVPSNAPCTYRATFLGDVTIPDNSSISPGQPFRKTWRLRNDGTCGWGSNDVVHSVTNVNNNPLGAPVTIGMPSVPPGGVVDLSIDMIAPNQPGLHRSEWMFMVNEGGLRGVGAQGETPLYVQISVVGLP